MRYLLKNLYKYKRITLPFLFTFIPTNSKIINGFINTRYFFYQSKIIDNFNFNNVLNRRVELNCYKLITRVYILTFFEYKKFIFIYFIYKKISISCIITLI